jgi:hypothetical protein
LDASSVQTALEGSRRIVWMIIGMIKRIRHRIGCQGKQRPSSSFRSPPRRTRDRTGAAPPSRRVRPPASIALDRDPGQPPARRPRSVAGEGRAFGACCFAGKLRSPAHASGDAATRPNFRTATPTSTPTSFPTRWGCVPLASLVERISAGHSPFVRPVSRKNGG